mmetsp:Transcript_34706/g.81326  ORF Transcript_34706/g.81326 Transcript_34706/m.81326 type:complete len:323 (+) Transcript_34706:241-1209(+)
MCAAPANGALITALCVFKRAFKLHPVAGHPRTLLPEHRRFGTSPYLRSFSRPLGVRQRRENPRGAHHDDGGGVGVWAAREVQAEERADQHQRRHHAERHLFLAQAIRESGAAGCAIAACAVWRNRQLREGQHERWPHKQRLGRGRVLTLRLRLGRCRLAHCCLARRAAVWRHDLFRDVWWRGGRRVQRPRRRRRVRRRRHTRGRAVWRWRRGAARRRAPLRCEVTRGGAAEVVVLVHARWALHIVANALEGRCAAAKAAQGRLAAADASGRAPLVDEEVIDAERLVGRRRREALRRARDVCGGFDRCSRSRCSSRSFVALCE